MIRHIAASALIVFSFAFSAHGANFHDEFGRDPGADAARSAILSSLDYRSGKVELADIHVTLAVPDDFFFLDKNDAFKLLTQVWNNPPEAAKGIHGMLFPRAYAPDDSRSWGPVIGFSEDGYVSDADAASTDYAALLKEMQDQTEKANETRLKAGFEPIRLIGWAQQPFYDKEAHTLHWARELLFGKDPAGPKTLNYAVRVLGREGVLEMNFVADMAQLPEIKAAIPQTMAMVTFKPGKTYNDHAEGDKIAAYGLAGLIAAGAGAKIAAKVGLIALGLGLLKKFPIILLAFGGGILAFFRRLFGGGKKPDA